MTAALRAVACTLAIGFAATSIRGQGAAPVPGERPEGAPLSGAALLQRTEEVTSELRCPVCQGLSVADSHTPTAVAMKEQARELLRQGFSKRQVLAHFETSYGEFVRLAPKPEGFNLVVWVAPFLVLAGGVVLLARRFRARPVAAPRAAPSDPGLDAYRQKLRDEIRRS